MCRRWARRLLRFVGPQQLAIVSMDAPGAMDLHRDLSYAKALKAVQLVLPNGRLCEGAEAAFQALALRPGLGLLKIIYYIPPIRQASDLSYRFIARNRNRCPACDR
jgi:predicted DCC family thiol-disulfide oxidoreductase YuxK